MSVQYEHFKNKLTNKIYASSQFPETEESILNPLPRKLRIISGVTDIDEFLEFAKVREEIVLRRTPAEREEIKAVIVEDEREILTLIVQRFMVKSGNIKEFSISFDREMTGKLLKILSIVFFGKMENPGKIHYRDFEISENDLISILLKGAGNSATVVEKYLVDNVTDRDIVALKYRKDQLSVFEQMLESDSSELEWQAFFERNPWIFGYGLNYVFMTGLDEKKLEQVVASYSFKEHTKRTDALLKTRGAISSLCLVEIKKANTKLLDSKSYREEVWPVSEDLRGGVAQCHKTAMKLMKSLFGKEDMKNDTGDPTGEIVFSYIPKSFLVIGDLSEFVTENGVNMDKFSSFEFYRKNTSNPEIITYDELYQRACFIVNDQFNKVEDLFEKYDVDEYDEEVPF